MGTLRDRRLAAARGEPPPPGVNPPDSDELPSATIAGLMPAPVRCCGFAIGPVTFAHYLALKAIGSPFVVEGAPGGDLDVVHAVALLSTTPDLATLLAETPEELKRAGGRVSGAIPPSAIPELAQAVKTAISAAFDLAQPFHAADGESKKKAQ